MREELDRHVNLVRRFQRLFRLAAEGRVMMILGKVGLGEGVVMTGAVRLSFQRE